MSDRLIEIALLENPKGVKEKEEHTCAFAFPEKWTKEDYLEFVAEWKETYRNHSEHARLGKRYRKTVHNVITPQEEQRYAETGRHSSYQNEAFYNGWRSFSGVFFTLGHKRRARWLLAIRKAGKIWSVSRRAPRTEFKDAA